MEEKKWEVVDRLLGFDSRELQLRMTEGLAGWHHRRKEAARNRRSYAATVCVMLVLVQASYLLAPTLNYRLSNDRLSYDQAVEINNNMLRQ